MTIEMRCNMTFFDHLTPLAQVSTSQNADGRINVTITFLRSRYPNDVIHEFLVMWYHWHWHWCHMVPIVSSMAPLHSLGQGNQIEMMHDFLVMWYLWHHKVKRCPWHHHWHHCIPWVKLIKMRYNMTYLVLWHHWYYHMMPMVSSMAPLHFSGQDNWMEMQHDLFVIWCHCISIIWQHWHCQWHMALLQHCY